MISFLFSRRLSNLLKKIYGYAQLIILFFFDVFFSMYFLIRRDRKRALKRKFVIGVQEIAGNILLLKKTLTDAYSVALTHHHFYEMEYDFRPIKNNALKIIFSPILLAYLSKISDVFIYVWETGFILDRKYDFIYLKQKGKKIITIFVGDDIRSIKRCIEYFDHLDMDCSFHYRKWLHPYFGTDDYENDKKNIAALADKYSDVIIGSKYGQFPYITRDIYAYTYMIDLNESNIRPDKFQRMENICILHAPSSPVTKGTPLVRAAIKKLKIEGYHFDYIELVNVSHSKVRELLSRSHIVLNQFYALSPGLFGIEAMAAGNAVLMSADPDLNPELPDEGRDAWIITHYWEIYDKLKMLFENRELIREYAMRGRAFIETHYTLDKAREYFFDIFKKEGVL